MPLYSFGHWREPIPIFDCSPPRPLISPRMSRKRPVQMESMAKEEGSKVKFWEFVWPMWMPRAEVPLLTKAR